MKLTKQTLRANITLYRSKLVRAMEMKAEALVNMNELEHIYWTAQEEQIIEALTKYNELYNK